MEGIGLPCMTVWALFGSSLRGWLAAPRAALAFNVAMALALATTAVMMVSKASHAPKVLMFELTRDSHQPLVDQICERLTQLVRHGQLSRAPDCRRFASSHGRSAPARSRW